MKKGNLKVKFKVGGKNVELIPKFLYLKGVSVYKFKLLSKNQAILIIDFKDIHKFFAICKNMCYNKQIMGYGGLFSPLAIFISKIGAVLGACLFIFLSQYFDNFILKVEIQGSGSYYSLQTLKVVEDFGIKKYSKFSSFNLKNLEISILKSNPNLSFVSCEKRGNRLIINCYVNGNESSQQNKINKDLTSNVDGILESLVVVRGTPLKKVGDTINANESIVGAYFLGSEDKIFETFVIARATIKTYEEYFFNNLEFNEENKQICKTVSLFYSDKECLDCEFFSKDGGILVKLTVRVNLSGG